MLKIRDISSFKSERPEQYNAACELDDKLKKGAKCIMLFGSLKVGKREVIECLSVIRQNTSSVIYAISLNRKDLKDQVDEFNAYNKSGFAKLEILSLGKSNVKPEIENFDNSKHYVIVVDECDYGDNNEQKLNHLYNKYSSITNVQWIFTSATPLSLMAHLSKFNSNIDYVSIKCPPNYCKLSNMTDVNIIESDFYDKSFNKKNVQMGGLSTEFKRVLFSFRNQTDYPKLIVRSTGLDVRKIKKVREMIREYQLSLGLAPIINVTLVDQNNSFEWIKDNWSGHEIIIVKHTFTRGTETNIQPYLFACYDSRCDSACNTMMQALGRHCGFHNNSHIKLFISESAQNYIDAYSFLEDELQNNSPIDYIIDSLNNDFNIKKFSGNTNSANEKKRSNAGTFNWTINNNPNIANYSRHINVNMAQVTNARYAEAILSGFKTGGNQNSNGYLVLENIIDSINKCIKNNNYTCAKSLEKLKQKFNLNDFGKYYFDGIKVAQPVVKNNVETNSIYKNIDQLSFQ